MSKETIKFKSASEAMQMTIANSVKLDFILESIYHAASSGVTFTIFVQLIDKEAETELKEMGFMFGTMKDPMGQKMTKISWLD